MKSLFFLALPLVLGVGMAQSAQKWMFSYQPVQGHHAIYGGALGDPLAPTSKDKQIAFRIDGKAAKQLFGLGICPKGFFSFLRHLWRLSR